jgi:hypothetical protein
MEKDQTTQSPMAPMASDWVINPNPLWNGEWDIQDIITYVLYI